MNILQFDHDEAVQPWRPLRSGVGLARARADAQGLEALDSFAKFTEQLEQPAILLNEATELHHANRAAIAEFQVASHNNIASKFANPITPMSRECWSSALEQARNSGSAIRLERQGQELRVFLFRALRDPALDDAIVGFMVTSNRRSSIDTRILEAYAQDHDLTACETEALALSCMGLTIAKMAQRRRVKASTIRTHVKSVLSKTDCGSLRDLQADLARLCAV